MLIVKILGNIDTPAYKESEKIVKKLGMYIWNENSPRIDVSIAPLLMQKISDEELSYPHYGTLVFHPSPLPYGRGASSIKWAYKRGDPITAATWFWADSGYDTGNICEQEIVKIDYTIRPRDFYLNDIIPAMARTLERCLMSLQIGVKREIPQINKYSSFDVRI